MFKQFRNIKTRSWTYGFSIWENSDVIYNELIDTTHHISQEDIIKCGFRNKLEQAKKEIENTSTYHGIYLDRADILKIMDKLIEGR